MEWTAVDEKGFGDFVRSIAESGCTTTFECLKGLGNPYRNDDPKSFRLLADCAKFPYMLRAYYAWKNGLPFSYVNAISGATSDARFNLKTNKPVSRRDLIDKGDGIAAIQAITEIGAGVSTATYRIDPAIGSAVLPDFYSPKI